MRSQVDLSGREEVNRKKREELGAEYPQVDWRERILQEDLIRKYESRPEAQADTESGARAFKLNGGIVRSWNGAPE